MRILLFVLASIVGAVAIWLSYFKSKNTADEWEGVVIEKRESLDNTQAGSRRICLLTVENEVGERSDIEVDATLYEEVKIGDSIAKNADESKPSLCRLTVST